MNTLAVFLAAAVSLPQEPRDAVPNWSAPPLFAPLAVEASTESGARVSEGGAAPDAVPTDPLVLVGIAPCRLVDTRGVPDGPTGAYGPPALVANASRSFDVDAGSCPGIPATAGAFSLNFTVIASPGAYQNAFLTVFPTGGAQPTVSTLNFDGGELAANAAVVPAGTGGSFDAFVNAAAHLIVDVNGYYVPLSSQTGSVVTSLAGGTGALTLSGTNGITASRVGQAITVTSNATSNATASTIASRDADGLLRSTGIDLGTLQGTSNLVFASGTRLMHRTSGSLFLGGNAGSLATVCTDCVGVGASALAAATTGNSNTAIGALAARFLTAGDSNTAVGRNALGNATGATPVQNNVAVGDGTLAGVTTSGAGFNVAVGSSAGPISFGDFNVFVGAQAGSQLLSGSNNIHIGFQTGPSAFTAESNTIRIGRAAHTSTFVGGISGQTSASGVAVLINSSGKLGTTTSSRRYKTDIEDVEERSDVLSKLRPVTFLYREDLDPDRVRQYGLIAEEVAEVAPDLVVLGEDGRPETVRYHLLVPLLLDALQKQQREIQELRREVRALASAGGAAD